MADTDDPGIRADPAAPPATSQPHETGAPTIDKAVVKAVVKEALTEILYEIPGFRSLMAGVSPVTGTLARQATGTQSGQPHTSTHPPLAQAPQNPGTSNPGRGKSYRLLYLSPGAVLAALGMTTATRRGCPLRSLFTSTTHRASTYRYKGIRDMQGDWPA